MITKKIKRPKPVPIFNKNSGSYRLRFYYNGKQYRSRYIRDENIANTLQSKINSSVIQFKNGLLHIPEGISVEDFIFSCVQPSKSKQETKSKPTPTKLSQLLQNTSKTYNPQSKLKVHAI